MLTRFNVVLEQDTSDSGYTVTVPGLPGCVTEGDTIEEALVNAKEAIRGFIDASNGSTASFWDNEVDLGTNERLKAFDELVGEIRAASDEAMPEFDRIRLLEIDV